MAFFDELQKSVTDAAAAAAKKTSELTGIARVKFNIRAEEARLRSTFSKIGSLFYASEREGADNAAEIATLIMQADKIKGDIAAYREKLAEYRKTTICPSCGTEVPKDVYFCPICGLKQERPEPEENDDSDIDIDSVIDDTFDGESKDDKED